MKKGLTLLIVSCTLTGCINITAKLSLDNDSVKPVLKGWDCAPIFFGVGWGTVTMEQAMRQGINGDETFTPKTIEVPIRKVHSVSLTDTQFLFFGERCVEVTGEQ